MRLTPPSKLRIKQTNTFHSFFGGAEANVAINLSNYGHETTFLTVLPINDLGDQALNVLKSSGVDTSYIYRIDERLGIYFYEEGFSVKQPDVLYDRKNSAALNLSEKQIEWDSIFSNKDILHLSGIRPALNEKMRIFTLKAVSEAKQRDITVSFHFNYHSKLWAIEEAKKVYLQILSYVDICFLGFKDLKPFFEMDSTSQCDKEMLKEYYKKISQTYNINYIAGTNRKIISQSKNELTGFIYHNGYFEESDRKTFEVLERIGGGDAFASGILHGVLTSMSINKTLEFGINSSVLKHMVYGDYTNFTEEEVENFIEDNG